MTTYQTPGVFVEEKSVFPPSVGEVGTAIPAFIGYTEKALRGTVDLSRKPTKIYSLKEYEDLFGLPYAETLTVNATVLTQRADGSPTREVQSVAVSPPPTVPQFLLYYAVKMFFDNGGAQCYIVSVGAYPNTPPTSGSPNPIVWNGTGGTSGLKSGLDAVELEDEPTLIVVPDAVKLTSADYKSLVEEVLKQCGNLQDRFAIFDILYGNSKPEDTVPAPASGAGTSGSGAGGAGGTPLNVMAENRGYFGSRHLNYGAVYYPFVRTSIPFYVREDEGNVLVSITTTPPPTGGSPPSPPTLRSLRESDTIVYNAVKTELRSLFITMPPSGAVAGVYAATDALRGVWKAPANVSLADVLEPVVKLTDLQQKSLNVDPTTGKSINAIRTFAGKGTLIWGARTLAGNDNEWRYIPVRRFFIMVEESIKKSTYWAVFEPNNANTWVKVRGMIENFLTDRWKDGALAGATPKEAFFVKCGLGVTMTAQDILQGVMNVEIGLAVVRPAEFIVLKFSHKLQTS